MRDDKTLLSLSDEGRQKLIRKPASQSQAMRKAVHGPHDGQLLAASTRLWESDNRLSVNPHQFASLRPDNIVIASPVRVEFCSVYVYSPGVQCLSWMRAVTNSAKPLTRSARTVQGYTSRRLPVTGQDNRRQTAIINVLGVCLAGSDILHTAV